MEGVPVYDDPETAETQTQHTASSPSDPYASASPDPVHPFP